MQKRVGPTCINSGHMELGGKLEAGNGMSRLAMGYLMLQDDARIFRFQ